MINRDNIKIDKNLFLTPPSHIIGVTSGLGSMGKTWLSVTLAHALNLLRDSVLLFDANNGLLLSKNLDSLFDLGYITFEINGDIVTSDELSQDVKEKLKPLKLNTIYINSERIKYLKTHRKLVFNKRFKKRIVI